PASPSTSSRTLSPAPLPVGEGKSNASRIARRPSFLELGDITRPAHVMLLAELAQQRPAVDAGVVAVVEAQHHRVVADRLDRRDVDVALARHEHALPGAVALHFGRR